MRTIYIGRDRANNIVINDDMVSRRHLKITQHTDGSYTLQDLGSHNGTYVNGHKVQGKVTLHKNDKVTIGLTTLPWQTYFANKKTFLNIKRLTVITLGIVVIISTIFLSNKLLSGIDNSDIESQLILTISDKIPFNEAYVWLQNYDAVILHHNEYFGYFHISTHNKKTADYLLGVLEQSENVSCVIHNQYLIPCAIQMYAIDNFSTNIPKDTISHGQMVTSTMKVGINIDVKTLDVESDLIDENTIADSFMKACRQMSDSNLNIVNISWGVKKVENRKKYIEDYANNLRLYSDLALKCNKKNFIITKSMGNESEYNIDEALILAKNKMNLEQQQALKNHFVIVAAKDDRKGYDYGYSNLIQHKVEGVNTIKVDISKLDRSKRGTSAAAPFFANWIAKNSFTDPNDVMSVISTATKKDELVSEETFREISKNIQEKKYDSRQTSGYQQTELSKDLIGQIIYDPNEESYFPKNWRLQIEEGDVIGVEELNSITDNDGNKRINALAHLQIGNLKIDAEIAMNYTLNTNDELISDITNNNGRYTKTLIIGGEDSNKKTKKASIQVNKVIIPQQTDYSQFVEIKMNYDLLPALQIDNNSNHNLFVGGDYESENKVSLWAAIVEAHSSKLIGIGTPKSYRVHFAYEK